MQDVITQEWRPLRAVTIGGTADSPIESSAEEWRFKRFCRWTITHEGTACGEVNDGRIVAHAGDIVNVAGHPDVPDGAYLVEAIRRKMTTTCPHCNHRAESTTLDLVSQSDCGVSESCGTG